MTIETLRGRYRLHRFPPRQRAVTGEPLTTSISAADYQRQLMDGHIVLTRKLAEAGHYPAIDIGQSISRCMNQVTSLEHQQSARALKQNYAAYMEIKPLIPLGGYVAGADASVDKAVKMFPAIERFLRQEMREPASLELVQSRLQILFPGVKKAEQ